jgi:hypothetical protein
MGSGGRRAAERSLQGLRDRGLLTPPTPPSTSTPATEAPVDGVAAIVRMTSREPRHCWVVDPPGYPGRWPGLVLQWALTDADRWAGRAVFAVETGDHAGLIELWLDQDHLTRAKVIND